MIGTLIGAAVSAGTAIYGAVKSAKERKKAAAEMARRKADNQAWYNQRMNEDPTKRASAQLMLTKTAEAMRQRTQAAKGTQTVMGGTEDSVTATKEANANAIANATSNIVAADDARKDAAEQQYIQRADAISNQQQQYDQQTSQNIANAVTTAGQAFSQIGTAYDNYKMQPNNS